MITSNLYLLYMYHVSEGVKQKTTTDFQPVVQACSFCRIIFKFGVILDMHAVRIFDGVSSTTGSGPLVLIHVHAQEESGSDDHCEKNGR